jgi:hypothetical protein
MLRSTSKSQILSKPKMLRSNTVLAVASSRGSISEVDKPSTQCTSWIKTVNLSHRQEDEKVLVRELLRRVAVLFDGNNPGPTHGSTQAIETAEAEPCDQRPYRSGHIERRLIEEVERLLFLKVIQPSVSAWSSPVVMVPKQDESTRFRVGY